MNPLSALPQIDTIINDPLVSRWVPELSRPLVLCAARTTLERIRTAHTDRQRVVSSESVIVAVADECEKLSRKRQQKVINATGVMVHTNLGRSPIHADVWRNAEVRNTGYTNLEIDIATGKRGARGGLLPDLLALLTGAAAATVVNNGASALYLMLSCLAGGREVIVSRGEQVQIGGGFRIPEILAFSGARLVEVGTTNICTADDYVDAVTDDTAMALLVHTSNFRISGFTAKPSLAELGKRLPPNVLIVVDQGSGAIDNSIEDERSVSSYLRDGADLVCFSSDKLLGGPQGGCIVGKQDLIERLTKHPLMRLIRPGKTVYSLLEAHLIAVLNDENPSIVQRRTAESESAIRRRCLDVRKAVGGDRIEIVKSTMTVGGGSAPGTEYPSWAVRLLCDEDPAIVSRRLRWAPASVIGITRNDSVMLDLGTVERADMKSLIDAIMFALSSEHDDATGG